MILRHNGVEPVPVPVDDNGIDVGALAAGNATAVLTTPAHQSPTGVVYLGSTSKTLAPGLRIGWMVLPGHLIERVRTAKSLADTGVKVLGQTARKLGAA